MDQWLTGPRSHWAALPPGSIEISQDRTMGAEKMAQLSAGQEAPPLHPLPSHSQDGRGPAS